MKIHLYIHPVWTDTVAYRGLIQVQDIPRGKDGSIHRTVVAPVMILFKSIVIPYLLMV